MCTQHVKYFRKVLIQKTFADDFSFQPYPTAKIRPRLHSCCTERLWSLPACSKTASSLLPALEHSPTRARGIDFVFRHTHDSMRDMAFKSRHKPATEPRHRTDASHALLGTASKWMTANHRAPAPPMDGKPGDAL